MTEPESEERLMETIAKDVLLNGLHDWVGLWEVCSYARDDMPNATDAEVRAVVLSAIALLLDLHYTEVGDLASPKTFKPWPTSTAATLDRIREEWINLPGFPSIGEICWLQNTEQGDAATRS